MNPYKYTEAQKAARAAARRRRTENYERYMAAKERGEKVNTSLPAFDRALGKVIR